MTEIMAAVGRQFELSIFQNLLLSWIILLLPLPLAAALPLLPRRTAPSGSAMHRVSLMESLIQMHSSSTISKAPYCSSIGMVAATPFTATLKESISSTMKC